MLRRLAIQNFVLIESEVIEFKPGLTIISGESGAGKTALIHALSLILGARADSDLIRKGSASSYVEGAFELRATSQVFVILEESGVSVDADEWLIIKRELTREGKNRCFINAQAVPFTLVQRIGPHLIDLISQHSQTKLHQNAHHRSLLDLFGGIRDDVSTFQAIWKEEKEIERTLVELQTALDERAREQDLYKHIAEEISTLDLKPGEDEALFQDYSLAIQSTEMTTLLNHLTDELTESPESILDRLNACRQRAEKLATLAPNLAPSLNVLKEVSVSISEISREFSAKSSLIDASEQNIESLQLRLEAIDAIKRKYGKTYEEIVAKQTEAEEKLAYFATLEERIKTTEDKLESIRKQSASLCATISDKRSKTAKTLSSLMTHKLSELNMEGAEFTVRITARPRTQYGEDDVAFWLKANRGEEWASVSSRSSGGELSRIMLAMQALLADKNETPTILFDEIDANVGGETATKIGGVLKELGKWGQVLCITHFPQVAKFGNHHLLVKKIETNGRTLAKVEILTQHAKEKELLRMLGGDLKVKSS